MLINVAPLALDDSVKPTPAVAGSNVPTLEPLLAKTVKVPAVALFVKRNCKHNL
jgi:hypothetical protein